MNTVPVCRSLELPKTEAPEALKFFEFLSFFLLFLGHLAREDEIDPISCEMKKLRVGLQNTGYICLRGRREALNSMTKWRQ
jgi:hypothetical protein